MLLMKIQAFRDATACRLVNNTDVSEERSSFKVSVITYVPVEGRDISEHLDIHQQSCGNLMSFIRGSSLYTCKCCVV